MDNDVGIQQSSHVLLILPFSLLWHMKLFNFEQESTRKKYGLIATHCLYMIVAGVLKSLQACNDGILLRVPHCSVLTYISSSKLTNPKYFSKNPRSSAGISTDSMATRGREAISSPFRKKRTQPMRKMMRNLWQIRRMMK